MSLRLFLVSLMAAGILAAQDPPSRVGRLSLINGSVSFQPGGETDWVPATLNRPLTVGDQLFADDGARAEIHLSGITFRLGSRTAFEFLNLDDQNVQVRLSEGTLNVRARRLDGQNVEVDTPNQAFTIQRPGEYRIDMNPDNNQSSVTVRDGNGEVTTNSGAFAVAARQQAVVSGQDQAEYSVYDPPADDDFDIWAQSRDRHDDRLQSSRYVSQEMVGYEDLDENGSWESVPEYGQAWIPRDVPAGWAPYHNGHWAWIDPWGWSWVDDAPWGFAPFHYGRWASFRGRWGWVPGPVAVVPVYAPALVAWFGVGGNGGVQLSVGFGGGGAGWLPLGPRDVYIPAYRASPAYVTRINTSNTTVINNVQITNVYNNYTRTGNVPFNTYSNRNVAGAAVAVPQNVLASGRSVQQGAVRMSENQVSAIRTVAAAPRVAPEFRTASQQANVPRPAAAVMNRSIVAKSTPPPPRPSFQQRQATLAKNPGQPIPVEQLHQIAKAAPQTAVARPAVRVMTQARQVTPRVENKPAPRPSPGAGVGQQPVTPPPNQARPGQPAPSRPEPQAQPNRPSEPPVQRPTPQAQPNRPTEVPREQPRVQQQPNRPFEPPAAQRPTPQAQPNRPTEVPREQPRVQQQPNRPVEPPAAQRPTPQDRPNRPAEVPREQPRVQQQPNRPVEPPAAQRPTPQAQPNRPAEVPREQPRVQPQPNRPPEAPRVQPNRPEPPREQPRVQPQPNRPPEAPRVQPNQRPEPPREQPRVQPQPNRPNNPPRPESQPRAQERQVQPPPQRAAPPPAKPRPTDSKNDKKKSDEKPPQ